MATLLRDQRGIITDLESGVCGVELEIRAGPMPLIVDFRWMNNVCSSIYLVLVIATYSISVCLHVYPASVYRLTLVSSVLYGLIIPRGLPRYPVFISRPSVLVLFLVTKQLLQRHHYPYNYKWPM